ncbi:hypothetical protein HanIR_Chr13g0624461 [Helianthus annuus]|nr:hypothetical protein HanIR_Chr13g0624461 [Helianthus annuus]
MISKFTKWKNLYICLSLHCPAHNFELKAETRAIIRIKESLIQPKKIILQLLLLTS